MDRRYFLFFSTHFLGGLFLADCSANSFSTKVVKESFQANSVQKIGWEPVPMITSEMRQAGISPGGEGGQWLEGCAIDSQNGSFLLLGTDVGGLYRSLDGGQNWHPCNVGYDPRGSGGVYIDPMNSMRCLSVGANSSANEIHGLYLSNDQASSWKHVLAANITGIRQFRHEIAYDMSSYDPQVGYTSTIYWSREARGGRKFRRSPSDHSALYKSDDGGETWKELLNTSAYGGSFINCHPRTGILYVANGTGLFKSIDGGQNFERILSGIVTGLDVSPAEPDGVWICKDDGVWQSSDAGQTWSHLGGKELTKTYRIRNVTVSSVDTKRFLLWGVDRKSRWGMHVFHSSNSGKTWEKSKFDNSYAFLPFNNRQRLFAWHPQQATTVFSFGGDWVTKSTDGGKVWRWSANGYNGIMIGGLFNFNLHNPDLLYCTAQDYNGGVTENAGVTWKYINLTGKRWGGSVYGGYAATPDILFAGVRSRNSKNQKIYTLYITHDRGKTVQNSKIVLEGSPISMGDPIDPRVLFAFNYRSENQGRTWQPMQGCSGVFCWDRASGGKELFGASNNQIVASQDQGKTWKPLITLPQGKIRDLAYDHVRKRFYITISQKGSLITFDRELQKLTDVTHKLQADQKRTRKAGTVAVDPVQPNVVYAGRAANTYMTDTAVMRSIDAGRTWTSLTKSGQHSQRLHNIPGPDGGREALCIRVHPKTRYAYVGTGCFGIWKIAPPHEK